MEQYELNRMYGLFLLVHPLIHRSRSSLAIPLSVSTPRGFSVESLREFLLPRVPHEFKIYRPLPWGKILTGQVAVILGGYALFKGRHLILPVSPSTHFDCRAADTHSFLALSLQGRHIETPLDAHHSSRRPDFHDWLHVVRQVAYALSLRFLFATPKGIMSQI